MDELRKRIEATIVITNCYRSPAYNAAVGGKSQSQHKQYRAIDFIVRNHMAPMDWAKVLRAIRDEGFFKGGIGVYNSFIHVDTRGKNVDWVI